MSQVCAVTKCIRTSRGTCDCCQQNLCIQHLSEHNASLLSQLNPLTDEINALGDRLQSVNIQKTVGSCHRKLEAWRNDCYERIDHVFQQKCQELDRIINIKVMKQQRELAQLQSKVAELLREQETTRQDIDSLTSNIHRLREQMYKIEHTSFSIQTRPLLIDDSFIVVKESNELDLSILRRAYKTITSSAESDVAIASNHGFLLIHQNSNLCLFDLEMNMAKRASWSYERINDMCWSTTLNRFIVVGGQHIYLVNDKTMVITHVHTIEEGRWLSCTCSETSLFLSTNTGASSIMRFTLSPSIKLANEWKSPQTCARDEIINDIIYNDASLGMVINNRSEESLRLELRSAETLDCIWSLQFDTVYYRNTAFRCYLLICDEWLVSDYQLKRLLHVTKDGKLKATIPYDAIPYCANVFADSLVISRQGGVNCHKL